MKFERSELNIDLYGEQIKIRFPNVKEVDLFSKKLVESNEIDATLDFLDGLGLKKELSLNMEADHLKQIIEALTQGKS